MDDITYFKINLPEYNGVLYHTSKVSNISLVTFVAERNRYMNYLGHPNFVLVPRCKTIDMPSEFYVYNKYSANRLEIPALIFIPSDCIVPDISVKKELEQSVLSALQDNVEFITTDVIHTGTSGIKLDRYFYQDIESRKTLMIIVTSTPSMLDICLTSFLHSHTDFRDVDVLVIYHDRHPTELSDKLLPLTHEDEEYFSNNGCRLAKYACRFNLRALKTGLNIFNYSKIHNMAFAHERSVNVAYKYFVLCNDDIVFSINSNPIGFMTGIAVNEKADIVGAALYYDSQHKIYQHAGILWDRKLERVHNINGKCRHQYVTRRVSAVTFAFVLISRSIIDRIGGLKEEYFGDCSDISFCVEANRRFSHIWYCAEAELIHLESISRNKVKVEDDGVKRFFEEYRNDLKVLFT